MAAMRKSGLVKSIRGALGGYELAHSPKEVTIGHVIRTLEGPILAQSEAESSVVDDVNRMAIDAMWSRIATQMGEVLDGATLADLVEEAERMRADEGAMMWHI